MSHAAAFVLAVLGFWVVAAPLREMAILSWFYDRVQSSPATLPRPDFEVGTLPWKVAQPKSFTLTPAGAELVTSTDAYSYQLFASVDTHGAKAADLQFELDVEHGGVTIGIQQSGKWLTVDTTGRRGTFTGANSAALGFARSLSVVITNNNAAGESRIQMRAVRLYLRR